MNHYRIVAISNPRSGRNKRGGFEKFKNVVANFPQIHHIVTQDRNELAQALELCQQKNSEVLIVNGGDGSLLQILTYLKKNNNYSFNPDLVLLQAGTTSMAYGDVGCKGNFKRVLSKLVTNQNQLTQVKRSVLRMTLPEQSLSFCGMFFGAGAIYNGIQYCRQNLHTKGLRGEIGPSLAMIRYLFDWLTSKKITTSTHARVDYEGYHEHGEFTIITATTLHRLLMGIYPFWGQPDVDNLLGVTLIKKDAPKAFKALRKIIFSQPPNIEGAKEYYISDYCSEVTFEILDGFTLDGELFGETNTVTKVKLESAGDITFLT